MFVRSLSVKARNGIGSSLTGYFIGTESGLVHDVTDTDR